VWDSFFLDGEIYAIKAGIGILKYFELELKLSTFDEAVTILLYNQQTQEDSLIAVIESINVIRLSLLVVLRTVPGIPKFIKNCQFQIQN
jgi:Na+-transporting NADH:ubiquinone oxidoreductase subunit NqrB